MVRDRLEPKLFSGGGSGFGSGTLFFINEFFSPAQNYCFEIEIIKYRTVPGIQHGPGTSTPTTTVLYKVSHTYTYTYEVQLLCTYTYTFGVDLHLRAAPT